MVGIIMRRDKVIDPINIVSLEILQDIFAIIVVVTGIDEHRFTSWTDHERSDRLADVDEGHGNRALSRRLFPWRDRSGSSRGGGVDRADCR